MYKGGHYYYLSLCNEANSQVNKRNGLVYRGKQVCLVVEEMIGGYRLQRSAALSMSIQ